jgi:hypothetical protein
VDIDSAEDFSGIVRGLYQIGATFSTVASDPATFAIRS